MRGLFGNMLGLGGRTPSCPCQVEAEIRRREEEIRQYTENQAGKAVNQLIQANESHEKALKTIKT